MGRGKAQYKYWRRYGMLKYFIKDESSELYYRDYILESWVDRLSQAHFFEDIKDAEIVVQALIKNDGFEKRDLRIKVKRAIA
jgi:hypothetical protein